MDINNQNINQQNIIYYSDTQSIFKLQLDNKQITQLFTLDKKQYNTANKQQYTIRIYQLLSYNNLIFFSTTDKLLQVFDIQQNKIVNQFKLQRKTSYIYYNKNTNQLLGLLRNGDVIICDLNTNEQKQAMFGRSSSLLLCQQNNNNNYIIVDRENMIFEVNQKLDKIINIQVMEDGFSYQLQQQLVNDNKGIYDIIKQIYVQFNNNGEQIIDIYKQSNGDLFEIVKNKQNKYCVRKVNNLYKTEQQWELKDEICVRDDIQSYKFLNDKYVVNIIQGYVVDYINNIEIELKKECQVDKMTYMDLHVVKSKFGQGQMQIKDNDQQGKQ